MSNGWTPGAPLPEAFLGGTAGAAPSTSFWDSPLFTEGASAGVGAGQGAQVGAGAVGTGPDDSTLSQLGKGALGFAALAGLAGGIAGIFQAHAAARLAKTRADAARDRSEFQITMGRLFLMDAAEQTEKRKEQIRARTGEYVGQVKASMAAQGIQTDSGSAAEIQAQAHMYADHAVAEADNNLARHALGMQSQFLQLRSEAAFAGIQGDYAASDTLLSSGASFAQGAMRSFSRIRRGF